MIYENENDLLIFLKLLKNNQNLSGLIDLNYSYEDIMKTIEWTIEQNYARISEGSFFFSELGEAELQKLSKKINGFRILPKNDVKNTKWDLFDIYVPKNK